jgi:hypothetical protein
MVKRIALKTVEVVAVAAVISLIYFIAETPLRLAEYKAYDRG